MKIYEEYHYMLHRDQVPFSHAHLEVPDSTFIYSC